MTKLTKPDVLDIGCGDGRDTEYIRQKRVIVVAVDYSSSMLVEARKRIRDGVLCQTDMRNLGFTNESLMECGQTEVFTMFPKQTSDRY